MFNTPSPRKFHYEPRFYDPEKEKWEALKKKYADKKEDNSTQQELSSTDTTTNINSSDLAYFENKVRQIDRKDRQKKSSMGVQDLFRKREIPKFNYQPRYGNTTTEAEDEQPTINIRKPSSQIKIKRKFDIADDDYMKPMPAGRIMIYALLVCLLLYWILF